MNTPARTAILALLAIVLVGTLVWTVREQARRQAPPDATTPTDARPETPEAGGTSDPSPHLALGNPSGATDDPANTADFLMRKPYFALSYNAPKGTPNWVAWTLKRSDFGPAARAQFYPDPLLPKSFRRVTPKDYTGSGYDRGHMCPRSDRTDSDEASNATFAMTNIVPQAPHLNQRAWNDLEDYCRTLVRTKGLALHVVAGPHGRGGEGSNGPGETIAGGRIAVPAKCWKVVLAVDGGDGTADDLARVTPQTRAIAVVMPNDQSVGHGWAKYRTSVAEVETLTGYRFFGRVPADILGPLKGKVDDERIPMATRTRGDD